MLFKLPVDGVGAALFKFAILFDRVWGWHAMRDCFLRNLERKAHNLMEFIIE